MIHLLAKGISVKKCFFISGCLQRRASRYLHQGHVILGSRPDHVKTGKNSPPVKSKNNFAKVKLINEPKELFILRGNMIYTSVVDAHFVPMKV
jgi:hypothetical protein